MWSAQLFMEPLTMASDLPALLRAESLAEQAYQAIREGIATGLFQAGERVTERGLATRLNVSATPVREALRRLEQEGLIERVSARQLRIVHPAACTLPQLPPAGSALRTLAARVRVALVRCRDGAGEDEFLRRHPTAGVELVLDDLD